MPKNVGSLVGFFAICEMMDVEPSLTLWRNPMKLVVMSATSNGEGWYSFHFRFQYKVMGTMPSNQQVFPTRFMYLYRAEQPNVYLVSSVRTWR